MTLHDRYKAPNPCPACGERLVFINHFDGHWVCTWVDCPNPNAYDEVYGEVTDE